MMVAQVSMGAGELVHMIADAHYDRHVDVLKIDFSRTDA